MPVEVEKSVLDKSILLKNKRIDGQLVRKQEMLEKELKKLGVDTKPRYSLEQPLGTTRSLVGLTR